MKQVVIVAGGSGKRMGSELPKQFIELNGVPLIIHTIRRFKSFDPDMHIVVVIPSDRLEYFERLCEDHQEEVTVALGGKERFDSVKSGLKLCRPGLVGIHDAVRPFVSDKTLSDVYLAAEEFGAAIPVIHLTDSIRQLTEDSNFAVDRTLYRLVQTPQVFRYDLIVKAYQQEYSAQFTDDASVMESAGFSIALVEGNRENIKITSPDDLAWARVYLDSGK
ncbi:MAG: 2-C-methyl-D-erythritol 4-phosphate cytidylyltransferase [Bacteroidota bacterium]